MELETKIDELRRTELYDGADVTVHQTHISVVFVAGDRAYKLKKPLDLGFVDYSTLQKRRQFCEAEVELNRRLAPDVYLGVRSVVVRDGDLEYGPPDADSAVDWVVEMVRLDEGDNFLSHLHAGTLERGWLEELGRKMASFHKGCERGAPGEYGSYETVARNVRENFTQSSEQVGRTVSAGVFERASSAAEASLKALRPLIEKRDASGHTRDTHGDLRLEHVYRVDGELCVVDCIEFNDAFRYADPVADIAFLVMDLRIRWADELADAFCDAYFAERPGGESLLDFYVSYRSAVRAKVHGITSLEDEVDGKVRERSHAKSKAHWLFAYSTLVSRRERPALVLVGGLPGTGKSTLARDLAEHAGFVAIDSDHVRKELAGVDPNEDMQAATGEGIYTGAWTRKTYDECLRRCVGVLENGGRVAVSATFKSDELREQFLRAAHRLGVPGYFFVCDLDRAEVARRIDARKEDASDANLSVYEYVAEHWDLPGTFVARRTHRVSTETRDTSTGQALELLTRLGLHA